MKAVSCLFTVQVNSKFRTDDPKQSLNLNISSFNKQSCLGRIAVIVAVVRQWMSRSRLEYFTTLISQSTHFINPCFKRKNPAASWSVIVHFASTSPAAGAKHSRRLLCNLDLACPAASKRSHDTGCSHLRSLDQRRSPPPVWVEVKDLLQNSAWFGIR